MQTSADCIHCYLKQAANCMSLAGVDEALRYQVLLEVLDDIKALDKQSTPAENSTEILAKVYRLINNSDPYKEIKAQSNELALGLYPGLKKYLERSENRLCDALKIAAAGNIIDLGISKSFDLDGSLQQCLNTEFAINDYAVFQKKLAEVDDVVIICDNSGEIVFDRLLAEEMSRLGKKVSCIVKGGPMLNDATMEDALQAGLDQAAAIISTGSNYLGAPLNRISAEARSALEQAGLVISKGQANFESLEHEAMARDRIFFLLKIKCECVGKAVGAALGDIVFFSR